jgi:hypothetical protein
MNNTTRIKRQQLKTHRLRMSALRAIPNLYEAIKWAAVPDYAPPQELQACDVVLQRIFKHVVCQSSHNFDGKGTSEFCDVYRVLEQKLNDVHWFAETRTTQYIGILVREYVTPGGYCWSCWRCDPVAPVTVDTPDPANNVRLLTVPQTTKFKPSLPYVWLELEN